jgi:hypothetical protein
VRPSEELSNTFRTQDPGSLLKYDHFTITKYLSWYIERYPADPRYYVADKYGGWYRLVEDYASRDLTEVTDRLVALLGLAGLFARIYGVDLHQYCAGLWRDDLLRGILWREEGAPLIPMQAVTGVRGDVPIAPSWSWASIGRSANIKNISLHNARSYTKRLAEVKDVIMQDFSSSVVPGVTGKLFITAPFCKLTRLYHTNWLDLDAGLTAFERFLSQVIEYESHGLVSKKYFEANNEFAAVQILQQRWGSFLRQEILILELFGNREDTSRTFYRRLGRLTIEWFSGPPKPAEMWSIGEHAFVELRDKPWPLQTVVIV